MKRRFLKLTMLLVMLGAAKAQAYDVTVYNDSPAFGTLRDGLSGTQNITFQGDPFATPFTYDIDSFFGPLPWIDTDRVIGHNFPDPEDKVVIRWDTDGEVLLRTYDSPWLQISNDVEFYATGGDGVVGIYGEDDLILKGGFGSQMTVEAFDGEDGAGFVAVGLFGEDMLDFTVNQGASDVDGSFFGTIDVSAQRGLAGAMVGVDGVSFAHDLGGAINVQTGGFGASGVASFFGTILVGNDVTTDMTVSAGEDYAFGMMGSDIEIDGDLGGTFDVSAGWSNAYGLAAGSFIPASNIEIDGDMTADITVDAGENHAYGLFAHEDILIKGDVGENMVMSVTAGEDGSHGNFAYGFYADADIVIGDTDQGTGGFAGSVTVIAGEDNAFGMSASDITIVEDLGGSFDVKAGEDNAFGLAAGWFTPTSDIEVGGDMIADITVEAGNNNAYGLYAHENITIEGNVGEDMVMSVKAGEDYAFGFSAGEDITIGGGFAGSVTVDAGAYDAFGMSAENIYIGKGSGGDLGGSFTVDAGDDNAYGLAAGYFGKRSDIEIGGDVTSTMDISAGGDDAFGMFANDNIDIGGDLDGSFDVDAGDNNAFGLAAATITIGEDLSGSFDVDAGDNNAFGLAAGWFTPNSDIEIGRDMTADITVDAGENNANGLYAYGDIGIAGSVTEAMVMDVSAGEDGAFGFRAGEDIIIGYLPDAHHDWPGTGSYLGTMNVTSYGDNAFGMKAGEDIEIGNNLGGEITVTAGEDYAFGLAAGWEGEGSHIEIGNDVSTDITVTAERDYAYGLYAEDYIKIGRDLGGTITVQALDNGAYGLHAGGDDGEYIEIGRDVTMDMTVIAGNGSIGEDGVRTVGDQLVDGGDNDDAYGLRAYEHIDIERNLGGTLNVWALDDYSYGLDSGEDINIGNDLSATINVTAGFEEADSNGAYGLRADDNILIGDLDEAGIGDFTGSLTVTAYGSRAYGMQAGEDIRLGGTFSGEITTTAKDSWSVGMRAMGSIYGGGDPLENPFTIEDGTVSSTAEGIDGVAIGIYAYDGMNLRIGGDSEISAVSEKGEAYAIRSSFKHFNAADDEILLEDTASLKGNVFLSAGEDEMTVKDAAKIDTVPVLDGGSSNNGPEEDILTFDGWTGTLGDEVVNWETIDVLNGSVVDLGGSKDDDEFSSIYSEDDPVYMYIDPTSTVVAQGSSPGEYILEGYLENDGILDLLDDEVNDVVEVMYDYTSDGGQLWLDADLSSSGKVSDERLIVGEDATGSTTVILNNVVSDVALTDGDGIEIVTVGEDLAPDAFVLGNPNDFGPFAVEINQGGEDNWYVQSPGYREEAAVMQAVTPFMSSLGYDSVMKFFERRAYGWFRRDAGEKESWWVRTTGSKYKLGLEGDAATEIDGYSGWFQVGADLIADGDKGTRFDLGLFAGVGYNTADVAGIRSSDDAGEIEQTAYGVGAYMSVHERGAWYLDAVAQAIYSDLSIDYLTADKVKPDEVWSYVASIEFGGCMSAGDSFRIEPQAQLIYQYTEDINLSTLVGDVTIDDYEGLQGRVSLAGVFGKCETDLNPFFEITAIRDFSEGNVVKYLDDTVELTSESEDWFLGGTIGLSQALSANNDFGYYLKAGGLWGLDGMDSYDYSLTAGLKKAF